MKKLPSKPRLPDNTVLTVLASSEYPEITDAIKIKFNIDVIQVPYSSDLSDDIATHADCRFLQVDDKSFIVDNSLKSPIVNYLTIDGLLDDINIISTYREPVSPYPGDVLLNATVMANRIICNTKYIDNSIREFAELHLCNFIHVNQGYAACSVIALNDNSLITDDESIFKSATLYGLDCLYVNKGSVRLKNRDYGFIGGTCGMLDKNVIAFTGKLETHTDCDRIKSFLIKHNIRFIELTDGPLIDIGGIIPLLQKK